MTDAVRALVVYRMERAREALSEAALLLPAGHLNAYVNRLYYACFYAVSALLVIQGISTSRHGHLRSLLHRDFVKTGTIVRRTGRDWLNDQRTADTILTYPAHRQTPWRPNCPSA
jgi:uncharacterized protein (UPF0332 family)